MVIAQRWGATSGTTLKGGYFDSNWNFYQHQVSDRAYYGGSSDNGSTVRSEKIGGRGVRSF